MKADVHMNAVSELATFLPWQDTIAQAWLVQRERFAHAWLIHGLAGIGKTRFALAVAASLLCEAPQQGLACGHCQACRWVAAGNHPDLRRIRPDALAVLEGDTSDEIDTNKKPLSNEIRIPQLRRLLHWFNTATHRGGWRVAVLYPAHTLNVHAANALLKVLEEPPEHTVFLLVAEAPDRLLPTLVSRCRRLPLPTPDTKSSLAWLAEQGVARASHWLAASGGAPLSALQQAGIADAPYPAWLPELLEQAVQSSVSVMQLADRLEPLPALQWIDTLQRLLTDMALAGAGLSVRYYPGMVAPINTLAGRVDKQAVSRTAQWLSTQRALADHPLNAKLYAHAMAQRVVQLFSGSIRQPVAQ